VAFISPLRIALQKYNDQKIHHQLQPFKNPFKAYMAGFRSQWILSRLKYPSLTPHWGVIAEKCFTRSQKPEIPVGVAQSEIRAHYVCNYWILIAIFVLDNSLKFTQKPHVANCVRVRTCGCSAVIPSLMLCLCFWFCLFLCWSPPQSAVFGISHAACASAYDNTRMQY